MNSSGVAGALIIAEDQGQGRTLGTAEMELIAAAETETTRSADRSEIGDDGLGGALVMELLLWSGRLAEFRGRQLRLRLSLEGRLVVRRGRRQLGAVRASADGSDDPDRRSTSGVLGRVEQSAPGHLGLVAGGRGTSDSLWLLGTVERSRRNDPILVQLGLVVSGRGTAGTRWLLGTVVRSRRNDPILVRLGLGQDGHGSVRSCRGVERSRRNGVACTAGRCSSLRHS